FELRKSLEQLTRTLLGSAPMIATKLLYGVLTFVFALLLLFFLLRDGHRLRAPATDLIPLPPHKSAAILTTVYDTVHATFYGIVLVALMQGTVLGITFWLLGLPAPLVWGMATIVLCTIPFAGAPIVWVPACLLLLSQGAWGRAVILAIIGVGVIGLIDNIFRPIIIGHRVKLHPMAVFFAIFGGIVTMGPVGLLVGPVLLSVILGAIQVLREIAATSPVEATD
ncbi:MAG: AI-2E family transporter, partial [Armatimonadetes bacterium]|nr:AI-2E family transporter [Armatimonadota bacterium]